MLTLIRSLIIPVFLIVFSTATVAATAVPYSFTAGTAAKASEVNADFQAMATAIDTLATRVAKLEGQITASDLVGTYVSDSFSVRLNINGGTGGVTDVRVYKATLTLVADGTGTITSNTEKGAMLEIASPSPATLTPVNASIPLQSFTWHLSGSSMIIDTWLMTFSIVSGGRLLIGTSNDTISGDVTSTVWLLTRTQ